jgi:hypothetical protein
MKSNRLAETTGAEAMDDLNHLIEQVWRDLDGQIPQARIRKVAICVAAMFENATVTTYIPLIVRHLTREWLKEEIERHDANSRNGR